VSACIGSSKNLKDLKELQHERSLTDAQCLEVTGLMTSGGRAPLGRLRLTWTVCEKGFTEENRGPHVPWA